MARPGDFGRRQVAVPVADPLVVEDVAGALLEVGGEAAPLQHLGQHVGRLLAGEVGTAELRHRVVAVVGEHPPVEGLGALDAHLTGLPASAGDGAQARLRRLDELVEEEAAHRLRGTAVAGEQRTLHHLGQIDDGEHRALEVGEVRAKQVPLGIGERLLEVRHGGEFGHGLGRHGTTRRNYNAVIHPTSRAASPRPVDRPVESGESRLTGILPRMIWLRVLIGALIALAVAVAVVPLAVLADLKDGGNGWGLCPQGLAVCRNGYFAGVRAPRSASSIALGAVLLAIHLCVRALRRIERHQAARAFVASQQQAWLRQQQTWQQREASWTAQSALAASPQSGIAAAPQSGTAASPQSSTAASRPSGSPGGDRAAPTDPASDPGRRRS